MKQLKLSEIEEIFKGKKIKGPIKLNKCETIIEPDKFIKSHIQLLKSNPGKKNLLPYYERLNQIANEYK